MCDEEKQIIKMLEDQFYKVIKASQDVGDEKNV